MRAFLIVGAEALEQVGGEAERGLAGSRADGLILELAGRLEPVLADAASRLPALRASGLTTAIAVSGLDDPRLGVELAAVLPAAPDAVLLRVCHGRDVADLGSRLAVHEAEHGLADGATAILAMVGSPSGLLDARSFAGSSPRLAGLGWDGPALATALGVGSGLDASGNWLPPLAEARNLIRLAAAATRVPAIETAYPDDAAGCVQIAEAAARDGFAIMLVRDATAVSAVRTVRRRAD